MIQRLLVVDDDTDVRDMICRTLAACGYEAIPAAGGRQALEQPGQAAPEMIITGMVMPGVDGLEGPRGLRTLAPKAGALVMSGGGRLQPEACLNEARGVGARHILRKPFTRHEMLSADKRWAGEREPFPQGDHHD